VAQGSNGSGSSSSRCLKMLLHVAQLQQLLVQAWQVLRVLM
jgi:hypothetical protein